MKTYEYGKKYIYWGFLGVKSCKGSWGMNEEQPKGTFNLYYLE